MSPEVAQRYLRLIASRNGQCFAGNHNWRRAALEAGLIEATHETGNWWRISLTSNGREAIHG